MKGKKGLILGVANERSIAWGISQKLSEAGAELAFTYLGDALKKRVIPLAEKLNSKLTFSCDPLRVQRPFLGAPYAESLAAEPSPKVRGADPPKSPAAVSWRTLRRIPCSRAKP